MLEVLLLFLRTAVLAARSRRDLALENLVLRQQLQVAVRTNPHSRLRARDRVLWVWLRQLWPDGWRRHLHVMQPETVLRWHRKGWRLYWTWKSRTRKEGYAWVKRVEKLPEMFLATDPVRLRLRSLPATH